MPAVEAFHTFLEQFAPPRLAESWDNVGLLVGDRQAEVRRLMTCLTVTPATVDEAVDGRADLVVTHHPLPFSALKKLTSDTVVGRMLLRLIAAGVAVYSPHTAFDSAADGINQRLAEGLGLSDIAALVPHEEGQGAGRWGKVEGSPTLGELAQRLMEFLGIANLQIVGSVGQRIRTVAVACGAAGEFLEAAQGRLRCDGVGRGPLPYVPGGGGLGNGPLAARAFCQRTVCRGGIGRRAGQAVPRSAGLGQPRRAGSVGVDRLATFRKRFTIDPANRFSGDFPLPASRVK